MTGRRNLKKTKQFLSLPGGVQLQTHQSQIFLSALIISEDTSKSPQEGYSALYLKLFGKNCTPLPGGFRDGSGRSGCVFLSNSSLLFVVLYLYMQQETYREYREI